MKKAILTIAILAPLVSLAAKPKKLTVTVLMYKGQTVYMDDYKKCFVIVGNDTVNVTKKLQNIKYNQSK